MEVNEKIYFEACRNEENLCLEYNRLYCIIISVVGSSNLHLLFPIPKDGSEIYRFPNMTWVLMMCTDGTLQISGLIPTVGSPYN